MKTILVTGAGGFAGSHILEAFEGAEGMRVVAACRNRKALPESYKGEVREGDLRDGTYLKELLAGVDIVCHAAAWSSLWNHERESRTYYLVPSLKLIEACANAGVERFLFVSTTSAAAPLASRDPESRGRRRAFWPHLCNVVAIEERMRELASDRLVMVNLRCGVFVGRRYGLGLLPILLPRLKTHLVPWVAGGHTGLPLIDGRDIGRAFRLAALRPGLRGYEAFNIVGPTVPTAREVIDFLHAEFGYPRPHFSVPFPLAYAFAWLMEKLDPVVPWEPLVTRSIVHLLEETEASNTLARERLGFEPKVPWQEAVRAQLAEMRAQERSPMRMAKPLPD